MLVGGALVLAIVVGAGRVPIPEAVSRFPDPTRYVGVGPERENNMVGAALTAAGDALRGSGPGPQQLAARWSAGQLNAAERAVVLLGGAAFHDPTMLGVYEDALLSPDLRQRQAAAVGFAALVGMTPPLPSALADTPAAWRKLHELVQTLRWVSRRLPLVRIWVHSYLAGKGVRREEYFAFRRSGEECLVAIRQIAQPEDLPDLLVLWPLLDSESDRGHVMRTIEMLTVQRLVDQPLDPHKPRGYHQVQAGLAAVDTWVHGLCKSINGAEQLRLALVRHGALAAGQEPTAATWLAVSGLRYAPFLPLVLERLGELGGGAVTPNRLEPWSPANENLLRQLRSVFPLSDDRARELLRRR